MAGKAWWKEPEAAGDISSSARKEREREGCWCSAQLLFIQCGTLAPKTVTPKFRVGLSPQLNVSEKSFIVTPTDVSSG